MRNFLFLLFFLAAVPADASAGYTASIDTAGVHKNAWFTKERVTAALLTIFTGPLGGHRVYLGTRPGIPAFYVLTLGGGLGILPLLDLYHILFKKDMGGLVDSKRILGFL